MGWVEREEGKEGGSGSCRDVDGEGRGAEVEIEYLERGEKAGTMREEGGRVQRSARLAI